MMLQHYWSWQSLHAALFHQEMASTMHRTNRPGSGAGSDRWPSKDAFPDEGDPDSRRCSSSIRTAQCFSRPSRIVPSLRLSPKSLRDALPVYLDVSRPRPYHQNEDATPPSRRPVWAFRHGCAGGEDLRVCQLRGLSRSRTSSVELASSDRHRKLATSLPTHVCSLEGISQLPGRSGKTLNHLEISKHGIFASSWC